MTLPANATRKPRPPKTNVADEMVQAFEETAAFVRGEGEPSRVHLTPGLPDVRAIRTRLGLTREAFALRFGLKLGAVRDWEQGRRNPEPSALTLLKVIERNPDAVAEAVAA